jgi:hypothetical protein
MGDIVFLKEYQHVGWDIHSSTEFGTRAPFPLLFQQSDSDLKQQLKRQISSPQNIFINKQGAHQEH